MSKSGMIIFDGDDTLWETQRLYDSAKARFEKLLQTQGFPESNIIESFDELDAKRVEFAKFSKTRFFESMLITYAILCGRYNKKWNPRVESNIKDLGFSVFATPRLYDDAISALERLSKKFYLILFTLGDEEIQSRKIDSLGEEFKSYFFKIYISETKDERELRKIINDLAIPTKKVWVVGNSVKSDINPALRLGLNAILIPHKTWTYEEDTLLSNDVIVVRSLVEVARVIMEKTQSMER